ncbi:hypothetical protein PMAYCL1PPCAC_12493 [Pristionchus mayeri]|uniref:Uncharacterized protein n=1 Tax=Pristionchus mayeri TaxID=1317129 RepID=A0AAN4ZPH2_9BILA|nr:hypothetical protein PMAYCL1PPCAC_12493 [Pristionchus mayeri]
MVSESIHDMVLSDFARLRHGRGTVGEFRILPLGTVMGTVRGFCPHPLSTNPVWNGYGRWVPSFSSLYGSNSSLPRCWHRSNMGGYGRREIRYCNPRVPAPHPPLLQDRSPSPCSLGSLRSPNAERDVDPSPSPTHSSSFLARFQIGRVTVSDIDSLLFLERFQNGRAIVSDIASIPFLARFQEKKGYVKWDTIFYLEFDSRFLRIHLLFLLSWYHEACESPDPRVISSLVSLQTTIPTPPPTSSCARSLHE